VTWLAIGRRRARVLGIETKVSNGRLNANPESAPVKHRARAAAAIGRPACRQNPCRRLS
jgi:hypothetical protein